MFGFIGFVVVVVIVIMVSNQKSRLSKIERELKILQDKLSLASNVVSKPVSTPSASIPQSIQSNQPIATANTNTGNIVNKPTIQANDEESYGKWLGVLGIGAVILGISFFLKYAFDNNWIGPSGRVMIGILSGIILLVVGQYLRRKYVGYSDLLMGGGIGVLYLSIFSAHFFFQLISPMTAGVFMFLVTVLSFAISITNATVTMAVIGVVGGFMTPFMANSGQNSMFELFTYLTILNLGIMGVSFFKKWPALILISFIGTVINFSSWFNAYYSSTVMSITLVFCLITFLIFLISSVARATTSKGVTDEINYFLLGGNSLFIGIMGYVLLKPDYDNILGFWSAFIAVIYVIVAFMVNKANPSDKALNIFLPGLAVAFLSVAVPLQFSGAWIAVAWLVESVFLYIIASFINNRGFQVMGVVVYILGLFNLFIFNFPKNDPNSFVLFFNSHFMTVVLSVIVAYIITYIYYKFGSQSIEIQKRGIMVFVVIANILTIYAFSSQIVSYHNAKLATLDRDYNTTVIDDSRYNTGYDNSLIKQEANAKYYTEIESVKNRSNTYVSIFWVLYAAILTTLGFGMRIMTARRLGLILFIVTAIKVVSDVWSLGQIYRIVSFIVFGVVALGASFFYFKFKDRLNQIV